MYKPVILVILDGWGIGKSDKGNPIAKANLPTIEKLNRYYPHAALQASGISVGLPWEEMGNSEVGHMTLGSGKIIYQNMPRITMDIQTGDFFKNKTFLDAINNTKEKKSSLHFMGLVGRGAVHAYIDHLHALLELAKEQKVERLFLHLFTDGRDSPPSSGAEVIQELQIQLTRYGVGKIATLCGRYFAMDRNNNWDRIEKAYNLLTKGEGNQATDPVQYLRDSYKKEVFDEYMEPGVMIENGKPVATIQDGDSVIFFNFREDRARQLTTAFVLPGFNKFQREKLLDLDFVTMVQYEDGLPANVAYGPVEIKNPLGAILSKNNLSQLRIAETEKFAHVTYFFNGGSEEIYPKEDHLLIPSIVIDSFAKVPQMRANEITEKLIENINKEKYDFILVNYANADMVGHTGDEAATQKAVEIIDENLGKLITAAILKKGCLLITADHGNAEEEKNVLTGETNTEHTTNPVPVWFITADNNEDRSTEDLKVIGLLSDVAPTILDLFSIKKPEEMTGESLLPLLK